MSTVLETTRLRLIEFTVEDADFVYMLLNSPTWLKYIGERGVHSPEDAEKYIRDKYMLSYKENGFGLYKVVLKDVNLPIGMCGLVKRETLDDVDIGFALHSGYERKGYAFEAASAVMNHAIKVLNIKRIVAITSIANESSINLLKKLGMKFERVVRLGKETEELNLYSNNIVK